MVSWRKGKTYVEMYGDKKAKEIYEKDNFYKMEEIKNGI